MKVAFIPTIILLTKGAKNFVMNSVSETFYNEPYRPAPLSCSPKNPCPIGSMCLRIYGNEGLCVVTK